MGCQKLHGRPVGQLLFSTLGLYSNFCPTTVKMRRQNPKHFHFEGGLSPDLEHFFCCQIYTTQPLIPRRANDKGRNIKNALFLNAQNVF